MTNANDMRKLMEAVELTEGSDHLKQFQPGENLTTEDGKFLDTYYKVSDSSYYDTKENRLYRIDLFGASDKHTSTFLRPEEILVLAEIVGK